MTPIPSLADRIWTSWSLYKAREIWLGLSKAGLSTTLVFFFVHWRLKVTIVGPLFIWNRFNWRSMTGWTDGSSLKSLGDCHWKMIPWVYCSSTAVLLQCTSHCWGGWASCEKNSREWLLKKKIKGLNNYNLDKWQLRMKKPSRSNWSSGEGVELFSVSCGATGRKLRKGLEGTIRNLLPCTE